MFTQLWDNAMNVLIEHFYSEELILAKRLQSAHKVDREKKTTTT